MLINSDTSKAAVLAISPHITKVDIGTGAKEGVIQALPVQVTAVTIGGLNISKAVVRAIPPHVTWVGIDYGISAELVCELPKSVKEIGILDTAKETILKLPKHVKNVTIGARASEAAISALPVRVKNVTIKAGASETVIHALPEHVDVTIEAGVSKAVVDAVAKLRGIKPSAIKNSDPVNQEVNNISQNYNKLGKNIKKRLADDVADAPVPKKIKQKSPPIPFSPQILLNDLSKIASWVPFITEQPKVVSSPEQLIDQLEQYNHSTYQAIEESEEDHAMRKKAKKMVADKIGLWGERLVYEKLKFHYSDKYQAKPIEDSAKVEFKLEGRYPDKYGNKSYRKEGGKAGKTVKLTVKWYNLNSTSCQETTNDHDIMIDKQLDSESESTRCIEVKTTRSTKPCGANFSDRELTCMKHYGNRYRIFRVYNAESEKPNIYKGYKDPYGGLFGGIDSEIPLRSAKLII